ncbi:MULTISPECIES: DUF805 domain-containing protein [Thioclava]|uniref:DUF805 domain-containing protein n=1 Tax=Thioclava TaxID=285107 RepID=UPI000C69D827|nr:MULTISPECIES: DUF805 domain-containing protein [Thioclava]MAQ35786.1 DUF805 domain-containing protein [Thioclava sp.]|tara:strand:+ start:291 stop:683 length:393 start_codon:yes stop_codon:yes gene_type:complete
MEFSDAIRKCFSNYVTFTGRAARPEFWWFVLFIFLGNIVFGILDRILFGPMMMRHDASLLGGIFSLVVFLPSLAVLVRRLHDTDRTGWWALIALIPLIGTLVLLFFTVQRGSTGGNRFGPPALPPHQMPS